MVSDCCALVSDGMNQHVLKGLPSTYRAKHLSYYAVNMGRHVSGSSQGSLLNEHFNLIGLK